jgi:hypothetical protein
MESGIFYRARAPAPRLYPWSRLLGVADTAFLCCCMVPLQHRYFTYCALRLLDAVRRVRHHRDQWALESMLPYRYNSAAQIHQAIFIPAG